ncbi:hypothetical protein D3C71_1222690 [compost metagenome]
MPSNRSNPMTNKKGILERGSIAFHQVNDGLRIFKHNSFWVIEIHRTLNGLIGKLHDAERTLFTV